MTASAANPAVSRPIPPGPPSCPQRGQPSDPSTVLSISQAPTESTVEEEEEGWFLVDGTPLLSPASTPPATSTVSYSAFSRASPNVDPASEWSAPRWAPAQARPTPSAHAQLPAEAASIEWTPPLWAPSAAAPAHEDELQMMHTQQQHVKDVVGVQGIDYEWIPPRWVAQNAGKRSTAELNAGETEVSDKLASCRVPGTVDHRRNHVLIVAEYLISFV